MRSGDDAAPRHAAHGQQLPYNVEKAGRRRSADDEVLQVADAARSRPAASRSRPTQAAGRDGPRRPRSGRDRDPARVPARAARARTSSTGSCARRSPRPARRRARDLGKVMGWLAPRTRGRADGKRVSELVAQELAARRPSAATRPGAADRRCSPSAPSLRSARFTRRDLARLLVASALLVLALTAILAVDIVPEPVRRRGSAQVATADILAPRALTYTSDILTDAAAPGGRKRRGPAAVRLHARPRPRTSPQPAGAAPSTRAVAPVDAAFDAVDSTTRTAPGRARDGHPGPDRRLPGRRSWR